jgi:hypothetical protein
VALTALLTCVAVAWWVPAASACQPDTAGMQRLLDAQADALRAADEAAFQALWLPEGYTQNL